VFFLTAILIVSVVDLSVHFFHLMIENPIDGWYKQELLMSLFSSVLVVLIGIEFMETVKAYLRENEFHVGLVILTAIMALARKIIVFDYSVEDSGKLYGIAILIVALAIAYFLVKNAGVKIKLGSKTEKTETEK
jgi:uncharacterized membrane protein (DUF373 family)